METSHTEWDIAFRADAGRSFDGELTRTIGSDRKADRRRHRCTQTDGMLCTRTVRTVDFPCNRRHPRTNQVPETGVAWPLPTLGKLRPQKPASPIFGWCTSPPS